MRYFDFNATTPLCAAAKEAWLTASAEHWHNASSLYREAAVTAQKLDAARERLAELLGCEAGRIIFTSGATEANNALFAKYSAAAVAISAIEHPSVREAAPRGHRVLPVDECGIVQLGDPSGLALVSVMAANNESGVIQPWHRIATECRASGVAFHTDATQWIGKMGCSALGECDYVSGSAHKFGGPKGVGFLILRDEDEALNLLRGGPQESGRRAGTENYPGIEAMVTALETVTQNLDEVATRQRSLRDVFLDQIRAAFPDIILVNENSDRLWNTALIIMPRHDNRKWLARLSQLGFAVSTGSACSSGTEGSSVVLQALGAPVDALKRTLRISGGWDTTEEDWEALAEAFVEVRESLDTHASQRMFVS